MSNSYKKNEIAKILGLKKSTIRYYEEIGLISPPVDTNDYREYGMIELKLLSQIHFLRAINLDISTIKQVIYDDEFDSYKVLAQKKQELNDLMMEYEKNITQIDEILQLLDTNRISLDYKVVEVPKRFFYKIKTGHNERKNFFKENKDFFQNNQINIGDWFIKAVDVLKFLDNGLAEFDEYIEVNEGKGYDYISLPKGKYICFNINFDNDELIKWNCLASDFKNIVADESHAMRDSKVLFLNKDNLNLNLSDSRRTIVIQIPIK